MTVINDVDILQAAAYDDVAMSSGLQDDLKRDRKRATEVFYCALYLF